MLAFVQAEDDIAALVLGGLHRVDDNIPAALQGEEAPPAGGAGGDYRRNIQLIAFPNHGAFQQAALPGGEGVCEVVGAVVGSHLGRGRRPQQGQVDGVFQHAHAVLAVVEHRGAVALVAEGGVAVVADLEAVLVIGAGAVGGPFYIPKLHLVDSLRGGDVHREADLQQAVQLVPTGGGVELHPNGAALQGNDLSQGGVADLPLDLNGTAVGALLRHPNAGAAAALHKLLLVVAVDIPSVEHAGHILVQKQAVHGPGGELSAAFQQHKGGHLPVVVKHGLDLAVLQHSAVPVQGDSDRFLRRQAAVRSGGVAAGRNLYPGIAAIGLFHHSIPFPGQGVEHQLSAAAARDGACGGGGYPLARGDDLVVELLGLLVHRPDAGAGQDVMELVEEHLFPIGVPLLIGEGEAALLGHSAPQLRLPQGQLRLSVAPFHRGLAGVHAPVAGEVQLAHIGVLGAALGLQVLKDFAGMGHLQFGAALQVLFPQGELNVIPAGTAAPVAVAVGQQELVQAVLLHPVFPYVDELLGVGGVGVAGGQIGNDLAAIHAPPGEVMIGELLAAVVAPEDLLGDQVLDAAVLQDLGQRRRVAKGVGQP